MRTFLLGFLLIAGMAKIAHAENWPAWRGADGNGHSSEKNLPLKWSAKENVRWKVPLPDGGNSTPIVWGDRVFITQALEKGTRRAVICLDRADGKILWQKETLFKDKETTHKDNPYCSASPVTDGKVVVASMGSAGMVSYDFSGKELWRKELGKLEQIWGNASSPILHEDLAILWCGPGERQFLLAVDKNTGKEIWEQPVPGGKFGGGNQKEWIGTWSTPIIVRAGDRDELVLGVPEKVKGYDPKTGKELWSCSGLSKLVYPSPVHSEGVVVVMSGFHGPALAVRAGGKDDVTETHRLWHHEKRMPQRIGSPVVVAGHIYLVNEDGTAQCFELKTGKEVWKERLSGTKTWSSLTAAGDRLYLLNFAGETLILAAKPKFELLGKNSLEERTLSSLAISDGELFIRTYKHLWCIGEKK